MFLANLLRNLQILIQQFCQVEKLHTFIVPFDRWIKGYIVFAGKYVKVVSNPIKYIYILDQFIYLYSSVCMNVEIRKL